MKILTSEQTRQLDSYTIAHEPIESIDLMERAAHAFVIEFIRIYPSDTIPVLVFCGTGNNGGDGLAIARLLDKTNPVVKVFTIGSLEKASPDFKINHERLPNQIPCYHLAKSSDFPLISDKDVIIDGLFGSGLSRPIKGIQADLINHLNESGSEIISIDIASGLFVDIQTDSEIIIKPKHTISFQLPKLAFMLPQCHPFTGNWHIVDIGLNKDALHNVETNYNYLEACDVQPYLPIRNKFDHKGIAGRLLVVAGSRGKMGAAILAAKAALKTGAGLLYAHVPSIGRDVLQMSIPEAMVFEDASADFISQIAKTSGMDAIAIGPGIGIEQQTGEALFQLLGKWQGSMVLDADALNLLALHPEWLNILPNGAILTPHPGEFKRLVGEWTDEFHRLELLSAFCKKHQIYTVLKGAHSAIGHPDGRIYFNSTGNPGMATGGSGDVLTGVIGALLAEGLSSEHAITLGVYLHGMAGDLAADQFGEISLSASDIINLLPDALKKLESLYFTD